MDEQGGEMGKADVPGREVEAAPPLDHNAFVITHSVSKRHNRERPQAGSGG